MSGDLEVRCPTCEAPMEPIPDVGFLCLGACLPPQGIVARVALRLLASGHVQVEGRPQDLFAVARIIAQAHAFAQQGVSAKLKELHDRARLN